MKILFISLLSGLGNPTGKMGMSGGDRIHINLIKQTNNSIKYTILTTPNGKKFYEYNGIHAEFIIYNFFEKKHFSYDLLRIYICSLFDINKILKDIPHVNFDYIISQSDFLPDFIPSYNLTKRLNSKLIFSFFLKAPSPFSKNNPYKKIRFIFGLLYFIIQKIVLKIINLKFDSSNLKILLASDVAEKYFKDYFNRLVIYGGVEKVIYNNKNLFNEYEFDAVFLGRLHDQKGALELIEIWKNVISINKNLKLAVIGNGPHEKKMIALSKKYQIYNSIKFFGFLDGEDKYKIFNKSKVFLHTPIYDTGGMALAEAMSVGLPGIVFDLEGYNYCYKKGVIKIEPKNYKAFANEFVKLINSASIYENLSKQAIENSKDWLWSLIAKKYLSFIKI